MIRNEGLIYLLQAHQWYKIGRTRSIHTRLAQLSTKPPFDLKLLHVINAEHAGQAEKALHLRYQDKRVKGEWFELSRNDVLDIMNLDYYVAETQTFESSGNFNHHAYETGFYQAITNLELDTDLFEPDTKCWSSWRSGFFDYLIHALWRQWTNPTEIQHSIGRDGVNSLLAYNDGGNYLQCETGFVICALKYHLEPPQEDHL